MGVLLFIIAYILFLPLTIINFMFVRKKGYFLDSAVSIDKFGNREFRASLNKCLIKQNSPYKFGDINETISSVLGKNQKYGYLRKGGEIVCLILDTIDNNHCEKSISWNETRN